MSIKKEEQQFLKYKTCGFYNMEKKTVYFVLPSMSGGGAERVSAILLKALDRRLFIPSLVLFNNTGDFSDLVPNDVKIINLRKKSKFDVFRLVLTLNRVIKNNNPDIMLSFLEYANYITLLAAQFRRIRPRMIICEQNDPSVHIHNERFGIFKLFLMRFTYKHADRVIAVSHGVKKALINTVRLPADKIDVIYNTIDIETITLHSQKSLHQIKIDLIAQKPVIISMGRLVRQKNFELLIRAFSMLQNKIPSTLIILGDGKDLIELKNLIEKLGISNKVLFPGFQKNPFAWMGRADLFVLSSNWEGFPCSIIEAMACNTPVIATDCPSGPSEIIENGINGILVPVNNPESLCEAMFKVLFDPQLQIKLVGNALNSLQKYSAPVIVKQYEAILTGFKNECNA